MRISDWSSDVCSSDLPHPATHRILALGGRVGERAGADQTLPLHQALVGAAAILYPSRLREGGSMRARRIGLAVIVALLLVLGMQHAPDIRLSTSVRSEERRVGKECGSTWRYRWSPDH